jgi:DNA-binding transcriptional MerR regulator
MTSVVTIGEFSRLTHLSVKALRHYHDIGLLEPSAVDPSTGYRRYGLGQVGAAQLIRRLRDLQMPLPEIFAVVSAADDDSRDAAIAEHLLRMERELDRTRMVVASLRELLGPGPGVLPVEHRTLDPVTALAVSAVVAREDIGAWCGESFERLYRTAAVARVSPTGPAGATYDAAYFEADAGRVQAFVPVPASTSSGGNLSATLIPGGDFVVGVHRGPYSECDRTYGAVGTHVAEHDTALSEPIREIYVLGPPDEHDPARFRTEICWPVTTA